MQKFYRLNETMFAVIENDTIVTTFNTQFTLPATHTPEQIVSNCPEIPLEQGEAIYKTVENRTLLESSDGIDFFIDKKSFKV